MIPHIQTEFSDGIGNCLATCIASILDLPMDAVPNFVAIQNISNSGCAVEMADRWLRENHGKRFIAVELYGGAGPVTNQSFLNRLSHKNKDELVILSGESPRKTVDGKAKFHAVVGRAKCWGFEIVHDPHPDGTGIVGQPYGVKWIVPLLS
jgi:hypothetical protein